MPKIQAIVLAGGEGSRLRPYTTVLPKPLMPLGGLPIAEVIIRQLRENQIRHIAISTGHLACHFQCGVRVGCFNQEDGGERARLCSPGWPVRIEFAACHSFSSNSNSETA